LHTWGCTFEYKGPKDAAPDNQRSIDDLHTPVVLSIWPRHVAAGTLITVEGVFARNPFNFDEVKAPSQEVPLVSVKIANTGVENTRAQNEPFGQSGTRCTLFEPTSDEPLGVTEYRDIVHKFVCRVGGQREGGRYNLSVALLGNSYNSPDQNMGEAMILDSVIQSDRLGESYTLTYRPTVRSIYPSQGGSAGGMSVTIVGDGFTVDKLAAKVKFGGSNCEIESTSLSAMICRTGASVNNAQVELHPGAQGISTRYWDNQHGIHPGSMENPPASDPNLAVHDGVLHDFFEMRGGLTEAQMFRRIGSSGENTPSSDLASLRTMEKLKPESKYHQLRWRTPVLANSRALFSPPVTAHYTFVGVCNDQSAVWINGTRVLKTSQSNTQKWREFTRFMPRTHSVQYSPHSAVYKEHERRSPKMRLSHGEHYLVDAWYKSTRIENLAFGLAVILHATDVNEKDRPSAIDEKQYIDLDIDTVYSKYTITLGSRGGPLAGSFKLRLGGKESRAISADASELEMGAALRELFSECSSTLPFGQDPGGSASDCALGEGREVKQKKFRPPNSSCHVL
jgi:hypothetical protein